jgi:urease accessory protein
MAPDATTALLLLADGRFPAGGHAHSAGVESAVADGRVHDLASLEAFTRGRLRTVGLVDAALAAATVVRVGRADSGAAAVRALHELDAEADARLPAPTLRLASRRLGRQLLRVASRCWPSALLVEVVGACPHGAHLSVATGAVGVAAGLDPAEVARLVAHHAIATPTQAAVKLLGLDPFEVVALAARLAPVAEDVVEQALAAAAGDLLDLPATSNPLLDIAAMEHGRVDARMFAT